MGEDKLSARASTLETDGAARPGGFEQAGHQRAAANKTATRTVGVYERPAQGRKMSLPLVIIFILAALVSVVTAARFLF